MNTFLPHLPFVINHIPLENYQLQLQEIELTINLDMIASPSPDLFRSSPLTTGYTEWNIHRTKPTLFSTATTFARRVRNGFTGKK